MFGRTKQGAIDLLQGDAPLNHENVEEAAALIDKCLEQGQPRIVFNLAGIPLIDSMGLELLADYQRKCIGRGGCMKLAAPNSLCRDILTATDIVSLFDVFDDELSAAGSFAQ